MSWKEKLGISAAIGAMGIAAIPIIILASPVLIPAAVIVGVGAGIGAAGYGVYRGGKAAVHASKGSSHRDDYQFTSTTKSLADTLKIAREDFKIEHTTHDQAQAARERENINSNNNWTYAANEQAEQEARFILGRP